MKSLHCSKCGAELIEGKRFCNKCGHATGLTAPIESTETKSKARSFLFGSLLGIVILIVAGLLFEVIHKRNNADSQAQSAPAASAMPTATTNDGTVVAPAQTAPTETTLQTLIDVLALDNASSSPSNDWTSLKQTGLTFSLKGSNHCVDTKISILGSVSACYSGTQYGPTRLTISKVSTKEGEEEIGLHVSHDTPVEDLHKLLNPATQVAPIRGACPADSAMEGTSISWLSITGKKPLYAYSMDSTGASGGFDDELTIGLNRDLDNDVAYKCDGR